MEPTTLSDEELKMICAAFTTVTGAKTYRTIPRLVADNGVSVMARAWDKEATHSHTKL